MQRLLEGSKKGDYYLIELVIYTLATVAILRIYSANRIVI